jgi:lantibiotic modifying enzyme
VARGGRTYLGFSHGAAGIGYFLLHLGKRTKEAKYGALAEEAAAFVVAHAIEEGGDGWNWERTVPPTPDDEIRIQWCHGSPGNGLFFAALLRETGRHEAALRRCLNTTRRLGRTARVGGCQCHGVAGNAELFLEAHAVLEDPSLLDDARTFGSAILEPRGEGFAVPGGYGPSYMLGLAGIGHYLVRLAEPGKVPLPLMVR